jgi:DNA-binding transcriptional LysR family regulator
MAALTYDFLGQTLERWQKVSPGVVVDCVEMDPETQERALLDGRIAVGILVLLSNRPILELLRVQLLIRHPVTVALPKSHPQAVLPEIRLPVLKEEPFTGLNRMYPEYSNWLQTVCQQGGFNRVLRGKQTVRQVRSLWLELALVSPWSVSRSKSYRRDMLFSKIWWRRNL